MMPFSEDSVPQKICLIKLVIMLSVADSSAIWYWIFYDFGFALHVRIFGLRKRMK